MLAETGDQAMSKFVTRFAKNESGATAIEYGLIVALIAVFIIGAVTSVGTNLGTQFNAVSAKL
jgi:pilus assembly protein Flp/PilA